MIHLLLIFCISLFACNHHNIFGYNLPIIALGTSHILDGGPLRPQSGLYWLQNTAYYHADTFPDLRRNITQFSTNRANSTSCSPNNSIFDTRSSDNCKSPDFNAFGTDINFFYQFDRKIIPHARLGLGASLPILLYDQIGRNQFDITSSGSGFGDLGLTIYLQFDPTMYYDRLLFVHRLNFNVSLPTGKYKGPEKDLNPGNNLTFVDPYWAFTYYFAEKVATSWRIYYLSSGENEKTHIKPGDAFHVNYAFGCLVCPKFWASFNGYFLQQIKNDRFDSIEIPNSKERVFSTGFGWLYNMTPDDNLWANFFFECCAKNREQGMRFGLHYLKHF